MWMCAYRPMYTVVVVLCRMPKHLCLALPACMRPSVTSDGSSSQTKFRPHPILAKAHHFRLKIFVRSCMMIHQQLSICGYILYCGKRVLSNRNEPAT